MKIPQSMTWPSGFHITVHTVTDSVFLKRGGGTDDLALWVMCKDGGKVYLRKSQPYPARVDAFVHEMEHAGADWRDWLRSRLLAGMAPQ